MLRRFLKSGISASLAWSGGAAIIGQATGKRKMPLVLGYHRVVVDYATSSRQAINSSLVSVKTLKRQLEWVARRYEIRSLDEVYRENGTGSVKGKPLAAITFDDGYADVYLNAYPILMKMGIPFAVFVATELVGSRDLFVHDELYLRLSALLDKPQGSDLSLSELLRKADCRNMVSGLFSRTPAEPYRLTRAMLGNFRQAEIRSIMDILRRHTELSEKLAEPSRVMDWDMVREMHRAGVVIGSHSKTHAILPNEDAIKVVDEVQGAREVLERMIGAKVEHFAYPDGAFDEETVNAVARAGYRYAYTVCFHRSCVSPHLTVPRRILWERSNTNALGNFSGAILTCQVNGIFDARAACGTGH